MGVRFFVKKMAKTIVEGVVSIVPNGEQAIFYPKSIAKVITQLVAGNFRLPASKVFTIEKWGPFWFLLTGTEPCGHEAQEEEAVDCAFQKG